MYKKLVKPLLFSLDPENAHYLAADLSNLFLKGPLANTFIKGNFEFDHPSLNRNLFGLDFKNPVGLAAGFDKNAQLIDAFSNLGFGFIEIGTVTPKPQSGNPKPRLFRLPEHQALINRMGFNNDGVEVIAKRLEKRKSKTIIGGNIGKNKVTANELAHNDYLICFNRLFDLVDYFVLNVSSPNTPNLRELQDKEPLNQLLQTVQNANQGKASPKPLLLKIAPDVNEAQLNDIIELADQNQLDGLIATNTTIDKSAVQGHAFHAEQGGLSGVPVFEQSNKVLKFLKANLPARIKLIGLGGINSPEDAITKLEMGADLIQIYTGFVYQGPLFVKQINQLIAKKIYA